MDYETLNNRCVEGINSILDIVKRVIPSWCLRQNICSYGIGDDTYFEYQVNLSSENKIIDIAYLKFINSSAVPKWEVWYTDGEDTEFELYASSLEEVESHLKRIVEMDKNGK